MTSRQGGNVPPELPQPLAGPTCMRGRPWGSRHPEDKLGLLGAKKGSPPLAPASREGTPLPGRRAPPSRAPSPPGEAPETVSAHGRPHSPQRYRRGRPAEGSNREPPPPPEPEPEPGPAGLSRSRRLYGPRPGLRSQRRPGSTWPGSAVSQRRAQKEAGPRLRAGPGKGQGPRAVEEEVGAEAAAQTRQNPALGNNRTLPRLRLEPGSKGVGSDACHQPWNGS